MLSVVLPTSGLHTCTTPHPGTLPLSDVVSHDLSKSSKTDPVVLACAALFALTLTGYKYYVRYLNRLLDGTPEDVQKAMTKGVTKEMVDLGFRFEGY
jgi:hypothetical protein